PMRIKKEDYIAVHSQSDRNKNQPLQFEGNSAEQAFDSRALCLPNLGQLCVSTPIDIAYLNYFVEILKLNIPQIVIPNQGNSLSRALLDDHDALQSIIGFAKSGKKKILSFFDPTETELELFETINRAT